MTQFLELFTSWACSSSTPGISWTRCFGYAFALVILLYITWNLIDLIFDLDNKIILLVEKYFMRFGFLFCFISGLALQVYVSPIFCA